MWKATLWPRKPAAKTTKQPKQEDLSQVLVTPVPVGMAVEKLRGFVADHQAKVNEIDANQVRLEIDDRLPARMRRVGDRPVCFVLVLCFEEQQFKRDDESSPQEGVTHTRIHVTIHPRKNRDRRRTDVSDRARRMLVSLRSYLMAVEEEEAARSGVFKRAKRILVPWLAKRR